MKIVIIGTAWPYRGGLATFNDRLAQQFVEEGHDVETYTFTLQYPGFLFPGKTQFTDSPKPSNLNIVRAVNSCNPFNWVKVGKQLRKKNADLVIFAYWMSFFSPCYGTIARIIKRNRNTRCVALVHNMIPHEPNILDKLLPQYFVNTMDGFTTLSQAVINDIDKFDRKNAPKSWAPHPIYDHYGEHVSKTAALQQLGLEITTSYILFFGFIRSYKGLDILLDAMADSRIKALGIKLVVAGEFYGDAKPYLSQIETNGISDRVILRTDFIPDDQVRNYFCACDLVAQPYKTATQSGVTQVAFHFEKPMLVTNVGGLPEIVPDGKIGYVVEPDSKHIADAIVRFYKENKEAAFIEGLRDEKKKYAWSNMTQAILQLLS